MNSLTTIERLSFNQITSDRWNLKEAVEGCARAGIPWIAPWRHKVAECGVEQSAKWIRDAGLRVSSLCRGGMFPAATQRERDARLDDNRRAVDEAAQLGAGVLVLVCGPAPDRDIDSARKWVEEGIERLLPYARERGVRLGIEPLHPMYAADRSVVVTMEQANRIAERYRGDEVGLVVDVFHVWWDPNVYEQIERAKGRILGFHISDWAVPMPDMLHGRAMMGDGCIELRRFREAVDAAGYDGPIEVEIFNRSIWDQPGDDVLSLMKERYLAYL